MEDFYVTLFGPVLREFRLKRKLSQGELARRIGLRNAGNIALLEKGRSTPSLEKVFWLAWAVGVNASEMIEAMELMPAPRPATMVMAIGPTLRRLRESKGMAQAEMARRVGFTRSTAVREYERGTRFPTVDMLCHLADALEMKPNALWKEYMADWAKAEEEETDEAVMVPVPGYAPPSFGHTLRRLRTESGLTQEELGFRGGWDTSGYISLLELGVRKPSLGMTARVARALGMKTSKLAAEMEKDESPA